MLYCDKPSSVFENAMLDLGIVIVNWNTRDLLRKCLQTVTASQGDFKFHTIVVDNASTDGSPEMVRTEFPQVDLILSSTNGGYSYANNLGLRALGLRGAGKIDQKAPRYALLLNPDTEVPPTALYDMTCYMDEHPEVGIAGPKLIMPLDDNRLDLACRRSFPTPEVAFYHYSGLAKLFPDSPRFARYNMTYINPDTEVEVDSVVGAYMQIRREAIRAVGLLDETFFMYGEDLDWAFRIKSAGWKVMYHPQVVVKHIKRAASRRSPKAQFEFYRAMLIFYRKHFRTTTPLWIHTLVLLAL
ncbi:MAG TPA: glycosyltransferase family 2 protein, partial [Phototrophicaceae bacterium]|nr:glycosyltransferase family 2 protein [Phototrophicaceae bacterium]